MIESNKEYCSLALENILEIMEQWYNEEDVGDSDSVIEEILESFLTIHLFMEKGIVPKQWSK